ncbi:MAG: hypothetical protein ACJ8IR_12440 [Alphaproteobacteria bacterium]
MRGGFAHGALRAGADRLVAETGAKLNINGGAIALGHPIDASGTRLMAQAGSRIEEMWSPLWDASDVRGWRNGQCKHHRAALTPKRNGPVRDRAV